MPSAAASAPMKTPPAPVASESSAPKKTGNFDVIDLILLIGVALLFDLISVIIPGFGDVGILTHKLIFWMKHVETKLMNTLMVAGGIVEVIPAISALPAVTAFVVIIFIEFQVQKRLLTKLEQKGGFAGAGIATATAAASSPAPAAAAEGSVAKSGAGEAEVSSGNQSSQQQQSAGVPSAQSGERTGAEGAPLAGQDGSSDTPYAQPEAQGEARVARGAAQGSVGASSDQDRKKDAAVGAPETAQESALAEGSPLATGAPQSDYQKLKDAGITNMTDSEHYKNMSDTDLQKGSKQHSKDWSTARTTREGLEKKMEGYRAQGQHDKADSLKDWHQNAKNQEEWHGSVAGAHNDEMNRRGINYGQKAA